MSNSSAIAAGFAELEKQKQLISTCTSLFKELSDHYSSFEQTLTLRSESLSSKHHSLASLTQLKLAALRRRESSIDSSVNLAIAHVEKLSANSSPPFTNSDLPSRLRSLCSKMDSDALFDLIVSSRKESDVLRKELPSALKEAIDPARLVMDAIAAKGFLGDFGWVCVLMLEGLVSALEDLELGSERLMVTGIVRERAREMAAAWRKEMGNAKAQDVHAFLQHLVAFGIGVKEERGFYRKLVVSVSWRKQMPKIAVALGLEEMMSGMRVFLLLFFFLV